jgi:hypothetical protein
MGLVSVFQKNNQQVLYTFTFQKSQYEKIGNQFIFTSFIFNSPIQAQKFEKLYQYVNPLIGTEKMGHTYPGATLLLEQYN